MKKILAYVMLALIASLWGCSDMGDRDNPTDPSADNYDASLVPGGENGGDSVDPGDGGNSSDGGEGIGNEGGNSNGLDDGKVSSSSVQASSSSLNAPFANTDLPCGDLWCGPKHEYNVRTGFTSGEKAPVGKWYHYIDEDIGGNSRLDFPGFEGEYNVDFELVIDKCGGICGSAYIGDQYENPYVGFGFFTLDSWSKTADITSWNGICVSYVSDNKITLTVLPTDKVEAAMKWDHFATKLPASKTGSVVDIPWSKFAQAGWGVKYDKEEILKQVSRIAFEIKDISAGSMVNFNIVSVGRLGSCADGGGGSSAVASSSSSAVSSSLQSSSSVISVSIASMTDSRDGQTYKTVKIGNQVWMAQNLNFETDSSFCYNDEDSNCAKYGRLYRWAVAGSVCPSGWHLPSKTEWETLFSAVGGESTAGKALKSSSGWSSSGNGTDDFGFSALPAGELDDDIYSGKEQSAFIWSSTNGDSKLVAYALHLYYEYGFAIFGYYGKDFGFSVRCIQDTSAANASSSSKNGSSSSAESVSSSSETHPSETSSSSVASSEGASSSDEEVVDEYVYSNTQGWACLDSNDGEMKLGKVDDDVYFVCDAKEWREATTDEEISCRGSGYCKACTENGQGTFGEYEGNSFVCDGGTWRTPNCAETKLGSLCTANDGGVVPECESLGGFKIDYVCSQDPKASNKLVWHPVRSPFEYTLEYWNTKRNAYNTAAVEAGTHSDLMITDPRDGNVYRTIVMNGMRVFAENLRYADSAASKNLIGQTSCYNGESKNCEIGGRYYAWSAAMDLNGKWNSASASSLIGAQHRGICPEGWHIPDTTEWKTMFSAYGSAKPHQVMGYSGWTAATDVSGFTALPIDYLFETGVNIYHGFDYALFWSSSEDPVFDQSNTASYWWFNKDNTHLGGFEGVGDRGYKEYRLSVRCIQDYSVDP